MRNLVVGLLVVGGSFFVQTPAVGAKSPFYASLDRFAGALEKLASETKASQPLVSMVATTDAILITTQNCHQVAHIVVKPPRPNFAGPEQFDIVLGKQECPKAVVDRPSAAALKLSQSEILAVFADDDLDNALKGGSVRVILKVGSRYVVTTQTCHVDVALTNRSGKLSTKVEKADCHE